MTLELDGLGKLYIRNVTPEAWDYLTQKRYEEGYPWEWYFAKALYGGDLRVYYNPNNFEDEWLLYYLDELIKNYGLKCSMATDLLLRSWRALCESGKDFREVNQEKRELEGRVRRMRGFLDRGCAGCINFCETRDGDDLVGYCIQGDDETKLESSSFCMKHGRLGKDGLWHFGQKYYPHSGCKFLEIKGERKDEYLSKHSSGTVSR